MNLYHITHAKAGSQWIYKILFAAAPTKTIAQNISLTKFMNGEIEQNKIYPTLYLHQFDFDKHKTKAPYKHFIIIRDPRDTVVSLYFSMKYSHRIDNYYLALARKILNYLSFEDGLMHVIDSVFPKKIIRSWTDSDCDIIKYEDLLHHDVEILLPLLLQFADCNKSQLEKIIIDNRFSKLTKGRAPGVEDLTSHERKGIAGDWRNHFSDSVKQYFKAQLNDILLKYGYEKNNNW